MVYFKSFPERTSFLKYFSMDFGAGFISLTAGVTGLLYANQYFWHPCKLLYKAAGPLQIPMILFLVILSVCGTLLCITSLVFVCGIAMKLPKVVPAFVVALLMLPIPLLLFHVIALVRVLVDKVWCPIALMGIKVAPEIYYGIEVLFSLGTGIVFTEYALVINSFNIEEEEN